MYLDNDAINRIKKPRSSIKLLLDRLFFPLIIFLDSKKAIMLGLTPLDEERLRYTFENLEGRALDIGCGENSMVKAYGNGIGVDVYPWPGADLVIEDTSMLPFNDSEFDCVTIIAALNHMPNRILVLREARRVLKPSGKLLITMITPSISKISHKIRYKYDPDQSERGMKEGEVFGFTKLQMENLLNKTGFKIEKIFPFVFGLNRLYIAKKG
jgi:SAM-dependent methyltransferase